MKGCRGISFRSKGNNILKLGDSAPKFKMKLVILSCLYDNYIKVR